MRTKIEVNKEYSKLMKNLHAIHLEVSESLKSTNEKTTVLEKECSIFTQELAAAKEKQKDLISLYTKNEVDKARVTENLSRIAELESKLKENNEIMRSLIAAKEEYKISVKENEDRLSTFKQAYWKELGGIMKEELRELIGDKLLRIYAATALEGRGCLDDRFLEEIFFPKGFYQSNPYSKKEELKLEYDKLLDVGVVEV